MSNSHIRPPKPAPYALNPGPSICPGEVEDDDFRVVMRKLTGNWACLAL